MKKPKETPPFAYDFRDPNLDVTYYLFAYAPIKTKAEVWRYVSQFLGNRKRRMPVNWQNLPREVKLILSLDGKVRAFDLPTQQQARDAQRTQIRQKKLIQKFLGSQKKKK